jgi:hypothetical protein
MNDAKNCFAYVAVEHYFPPGLIFPEFGTVLQTYQVYLIWRESDAFKFWSRRPVCMLKIALITHLNISYFVVRRSCGSSKTDLRFANLFFATC